MSTQPPVRYENYPPEQGDAHEDIPADPDPVVRPYVPRELSTRTGGDPTTRRTVVGFFVAAPIVVLIGAWILGDGGTDQDAENSGGGTPWDPTNESTGRWTPEPAPREIVVGGRYSVTVPDGWKYSTDGGGGVEFTRVANRLTASSIEVPPSTLATEELAILARSHRKGFTGKIAHPVDDSTADVQRASMTGTGTFQGKPARLSAELWIRDSGSGLLITRILTAKPETEIPAQAQAMVDELSQGF